MIARITGAIAGSLLASATSLGASLEGTWRGDARLAGDSTVVELTITKCAGRRCGTWRMPDVGHAGIVTPESTAEDGRLVAGPLALALEGDALVGEASGSHAYLFDAAGHGQSAQVRLVRGGVRKPPATLEDFRVEHDGIGLAGTFVRPTGVGPFPTLVHVHGSGPARRWVALERAYGFAESGIASVIYDKRGNGESGGDWTAASLDDLAGDAGAMLAHARAIGGVDASRVGFWAHSQGGWVVPRAIALGAKPAFAVLVAGGVQPPAAIERHDYAAVLSHVGATAEQRADAAKLVDAYLGYLAGEVTEAAMLTALAAAKQERWAAALGLERVLPRGAARARWSWVATYDPRTDFAVLNLPLLVVLGGDDRPTLLADTLLRWNTALAPAQAARARVVVYPRADHHLRIPTGRGWRRVPPDFTAMQVGWIAARR